MSLIDRILRRRSHYRHVFQDTGQSGDVVLADLRRFCRYGESPLTISLTLQQADPMSTGVRIGRAEVFARIAGMLHMDDAQLLKLKETGDEE